MKIGINVKTYRTCNSTVRFSKYEFIDQMVNYIWLTWKLVYMLRTYRTCNSTVEFLKYAFNNKLLNVVILFRVTSGVTWTYRNSTIT